jgi:archaeal flagellin FlaB
MVLCMRRDGGFSGLEAALIMIAFVVVAAIFGYSMISTGFFATQKVQEVTYAGIKQSSSVAITDGLIRGQYSANDGLTSLTLSLSVPETGEAIDLSKMVYYYARENEGGNSIPLTSISPDTGILYAGESTRIRLNLLSAGLAGPKEGGSFTLEIKPPNGASTLIQRTLPSGYSGGYIS